MAQSSGGVVVKGNVYGGGNVGDVGKITKSVDLRTFTWVEGTGNVFGGGDQSYVYSEDNPAGASTTVKLQGNTLVRGNVFGGGNQGLVSGNTTVIIEETPSSGGSGSGSGGGNNP